MITAEWLREQWLEIIIAFVFAVLAHYIYTKIKPDKLSLKTILIKPSHTILARLILPNNNEIRILENEKIFGRHNFEGAISADDLQFIGRKHLRIMKLNDGLYIEDLGSANGTKLNGDEIKGAGSKKLNNGDEILVADVLNIKFVQE